MAQRALIVGAGLAGSLLAIELARLGLRVLVVERRPDPRAAGFIGGRSINLALSVRGITALERAGLAERVVKDAVPMPGRMMHPPAPEAASVRPLFQPYSKDPGDAIQSVSRAGLNLTLIEAADAEANVELRFGLRCAEVDLDAPGAEVEDATGARNRIEADVIFGADGAFSAVRSAMQMTDRFDCSQSYLEHGYKELHIPPAAEIPGGATGHGARDGAAMEPNALHIWPRGGSMMIALPNADRSFTCTLFWPFEGEHGFSAVDPARPDAIRAFFTRHYPDAVPLMPTLADDYQRNPTSSLVTIRCAPWHHNARALLLGDAAHAIVPFFGQGMNAAFEDVRILAEMLERNLDFATVLPAFTVTRKPHADAIADMAVENFLEMRDKVGRPDFLYHKRVEQALHALYPEHATPLYNLVSFTNTPYADARRQGHDLDAKVDQIAARFPRTEAERIGEPAWRARIADIARDVMPANTRAHARGNGT
jgi:kynurenine 3-monooxygenase